MATAMESSLSFLLAEKGVSNDLKKHFEDTGITTLRLFALMAEDRKEMKGILADEPFKLDATSAGVPGPDKLRARVANTQVVDAHRRVPPGH